MSELDYPLTDVVVSLLTDAESRVFFAWNDAWGGFALPMTKRCRGQGIIEPERQATAAEIQAGQLQAGSVGGGQPVISGTVARILSALGEL